MIFLCLSSSRLTNSVQYRRSRNGKPSMRSSILDCNKPQLIIEWSTLSRFTRNDTYRALTEKALRHIGALTPPLPGLAAQGIDPVTGQFIGGYVVCQANLALEASSHSPRSHGVVAQIATSNISSSMLGCRTPMTPFSPTYGIQLLTPPYVIFSG